MLEVTPDAFMPELSGSETLTFAPATAAPVPEFVMVTRMVCFPGGAARWETRTESWAKESGCNELPGKLKNVTHIDGRTTQGAGAVQVEVAAETI